MSRISQKRQRKNTVIITDHNQSGAASTAVNKGAQRGQFAHTPDINDVAYEPVRQRWKVIGVCALLVIMVFLVFGQTIRYGFVNFDDQQYVYENPIVLKGLSLEGLRWAFTHVHSYNWHPLTTIFHMLDCQFYGLWAGGHHLTNVSIHAAAAVLLFLMLREMTGLLWRCAFVAAVFSIHPLRVESVAWVSELKDVLSGLFFILTVWAYVRFVRSPPSKAKGGYAAVALLFLLGLMSKPMLVTLPFVLLLLDFWPLKRFHHKSQLPLLLKEKLPLFTLSALSCLVTVFAQKEAINPIENIPLSLRLGNAVVAYGIYLGKMIYPTKLAVYYPIVKNGWPAWLVIAAMLMLVILTLVALVFRRKQPFLVVGWLWYLGMLVPVIGILQVGTQAYADRYTYLPQIGLCFAGTWAVAEWVKRWRYHRVLLRSVSVIVLFVLLVAAYHQTSYWCDSKALWTHTLVCTPDNQVAHNNLGNDLLNQGRTEEAIAQFREALRINPGFADAHNNLGLALSTQGKMEEAIAQFREALRINPGYAHAHNNLGNVLFNQGRTDEAVAQFREALRINPGYAHAHNNLGNVLFDQGRTDEAVAQFREALNVNPDYAEAHNDLGIALFNQGRTEEAIAQFREALRINPGFTNARNNLGLALGNDKSITQ